MSLESKEKERERERERERKREREREKERERETDSRGYCAVGGAAALPSGTTISDSYLHHHVEFALFSLSFRRFCFSLFSLLFFFFFLLPAKSRPDPIFFSQRILSETEREVLKK